jgi:hypothetical protein
VTVTGHDRAFERFIADLSKISVEQRPGFLSDAINPTITCSQSRLVRRFIA